MGSGHFDSRRHDASDLAEFAGARGLTMGVERAYRAWSRYSDSMCAGWMNYALEGPEADITFEILAFEEQRAKEEDALFLRDEYADVDALHERAEAEGLGLTREDVTRIWADHSATNGLGWLRPDAREIDRVLEPHRRERPAGYGF